MQVEACVTNNEGDVWKCSDCRQQFSVLVSMIFKDSRKTPVVSLVERGGNVRSKVVTNVSGATLKEVLDTNLAPDARLMTDRKRSCQALGNSTMQLQLPLGTPTMRSWVWCNERGRKMAEPVVTPIRNGWAARGKGWVGHAPT
ncbi:MAG: transposase [Thermomicrobiales bacterium]